MMEGGGDGLRTRMDGWMDGWMNKHRLWMN
jgi:hypothetical protein